MLLRTIDEFYDDMKKVIDDDIEKFFRAFLAKNDRLNNKCLAEMCIEGKEDEARKKLLGLIK